MQNNTSSFKHKSTKPTRIILVLIWIVIIGLAASMGFMFYKQAMVFDNSSKSAKVSKSSINSNALVVMYDESNSEISPEFLLLGFNGKSGHISVAVVPQDTSMTIDGKKKTLIERYNYGGIVQAAEDLGDLLTMNIKYYAEMDCERLQTVGDTLGTVEYDVPQDMKSKSKKGALLCDIKKGKQSLSGQQLMEFFRYTGWKKSERDENIGKLAAAAVGAYTNEKSSEKLVGLFGELSNELTTNLSIIQIDDLQENSGIFRKKKDAVRLFNIKLQDGEIDKDTLTQINDAF